jgi:hypothetical protein
MSIKENIRYQLVLAKSGKEYQYYSVQSLGMTKRATKAFSFETYGPHGALKLAVAYEEMQKTFIDRILSLGRYHGGA